jgi:5-formyltetrahydrofolate cyclo-ligase
MMGNSAAAKKKARKELQLHLVDLGFLELIELSGRLRVHFEAFVAEHASLLQGRVLVSFVPFESEPQIQVERESQDEPYRVAYVRVDDWEHREMSVREARRDLPGQWEEWRIPGGNRIYQPVDSRPEISSADIGVILVPGLGFTREGGRLGRGAGFYDRLLERHPSALRVGIAFSRQVRGELPEDEHDQRMDMLLTDDGMFTMNCYGEWKKQGKIISRAV